jgi:hypothetical protein
MTEPNERLGLTGADYFFCGVVVGMMIVGAFWRWMA